VLDPEVRDGREFHSSGAQAAELHGPKLEVRQASTHRRQKEMKSWTAEDMAIG